MSDVYTNNRLQYSSVLESAAANTKGWRIGFFLMLLLLIGSVAGNVIQGIQSKIVPVVVEIDGYGVPTRTYAVTEATNTQDARVVRAQLASVIKAVREVSFDASVQKDKLENVIDFFDKRSPGFVTVQAYITSPETNPFIRAKSELVSVKINNVQPIPNTTSFQGEWTEYIRERSGQIKETKEYKATFSVGYAESIRENQLYTNPTGVLIKDVVWSEKIN